MKCNATVFKRFADFCAVDGIKYLHEVKAHHVAEYFNIIKDHLAWSTVQDQMTLLAGAFKRFMPTGCGNPFGMLIKRSYKKESRKIHKSALKDVIIRRMAGESYTTISKAIGKARAQISQDLETIGNLVGEAYRPSAKPNSLAKRKALTRTKRENGKNAVSRYGWHSFRATFATIAHGCGVSDDTIIQIIGHTTFKTTENYIDYKALAADKELEKMSGTALAKGYKANAIAFTDKDLQLLAFIKSLPPEQKALALATAKQP